MGTVAVKACYVINSGTSVAVCLDCAVGLKQAPAKPIRVSIDGGPDAQVPLNRTIWDPGVSFVFLPVDAKIPPGSAVVVSFGDGELLTSAGPVLGGGFAAINKSGGDLRDIDPGLIRMGIGTNADQITYYNITPWYTNLAKHLSAWVPDKGVSQIVDAMGNLVGVLGGRTVARYQASVNNYFSRKTGQPWGAGGPFAIAVDSPAGPVRASGAPVQDVYLTAPITAADSAYGPALVLEASGPAKNLRIYPPGSDMGSKFNPRFLERMGDCSVIRFMDTWGTNRSQVASVADIHVPADVSYATPKTPPASAKVVSIEKWDNPRGFFWTQAGWSSVLFRTESPHPFRLGQSATLSGFPDVAMSDGTKRTINNYASIVHPVDATSFAMCIYTGKPTSVSVVTAAVSGSADAQASYTIPLEDLIALCNEKNCDMWWNVPILYDDASIAANAAAIASSLRPGLKCYVEYANEHWNTATGFFTSWYCYGRGALEGITATQWYTKRAGEVLSLAEVPLVGRIVRVMGSWNNSPRTTTEILTYAKANGIRVDAVAVAPYVSNMPMSAAMAPAAALLTDDQRMDLGEIGMFLGSPIVKKTAGHRAAIDAFDRSIRLVCYEGGIENGSLGIPGNDGIRVSIIWSRHPRIWQFYLDFLMQLQEDAGVDLFVDYMRFHPNGLYVWGKYQGCDQAPGRGDGSDGLFDNRLGYFDLDRIVSVGAGVLKWWHEQRRKNEGQ